MRCFTVTGCRKPRIAAMQSNQRRLGHQAGTKAKPPVTWAAAVQVDLVIPILHRARTSEVSRYGNCSATGCSSSLSANGALHRHAARLVTISGRAWRVAMPKSASQCQSVQSMHGGAAVEVAVRIQICHSVPPVEVETQCAVLVCDVALFAEVDRIPPPAKIYSKRGKITARR